MGVPMMRTPSFHAGNTFTCSRFADKRKSHTVTNNPDAKLAMTRNRVAAPESMNVTLNAAVMHTMLNKNQAPHALRAYAAAVGVRNF